MNAVATAQVRTFQPGDEVFLAEGAYQSTVGTFVRLRPDIHWAEVREAKGSVWAHPVAWLRHLPAGDLNWPELLRGSQGQ